MDARTRLVDTIAYALKACRPILRQLVKQRTADDEAQMAAEEIVRQMELSGFRVEHDGGIPLRPGPDWKKRGPETDRGD